MCTSCSKKRRRRARPPSRASIVCSCCPPKRRRCSTMRRCRELAAHLQANPDTDMADAAYTLQVGRGAFSHRRAVVCRDAADAAAALLDLDPARAITRVYAGEPCQVAFMFPGQGAQRPGMGRGSTSANRYSGTPSTPAVRDCNRRSAWISASCSIRSTRPTPWRMRPPASRVRSSPSRRSSSWNTRSRSSGSVGASSRPRASGTASANTWPPASPASCRSTTDWRWWPRARG